MSMQLIFCVFADISYFRWPQSQHNCVSSPIHWQEGKVPHCGGRPGSKLTHCHGFPKHLEKPLLLATGSLGCLWFVCDLGKILLKQNQTALQGLSTAPPHHKHRASALAHPLAGQPCPPLPENSSWYLHPACACCSQCQGRQFPGSH